MSGNSAFVMVRARGWRRGFGNLLGNELARWWKTRMGWFQCLLWVAVSLMLLSDVLLRKGTVHRSAMADAAAQLYAVFQPVGLIVLMQSVLVGEKKDGTAAWVLSKPASRAAFVLSKLAANALGALVTMVGVSSVMFYVLCAIGHKTPPPLPTFVAALGFVLLHHLFYLTRMLMLGAVSNSRGLVIGVPAAILLEGWDLTRKFPMLRNILPMNLVDTVNAHTSAFAARFYGGSALAYWPLVATVAAMCLLFAGIAVWRFSREEL